MRTGWRAGRSEGRGSLCYRTCSFLGRADGRQRRLSLGEDFAIEPDLQPVNHEEHLDERWAPVSISVGIANGVNRIMTRAVDNTYGLQPPWAYPSVLQG